MLLIIKSTFITTVNENFQCEFPAENNQFLDRTWVWRALPHNIYSRTLLYIANSMGDGEGWWPVCVCVCETHSHDDQGGVCVQCVFAWIYVHACIWHCKRRRCRLNIILTHAHAYTAHVCTHCHSLQLLISVYFCQCVSCVHVSYSRDDQWGGEEQRSQQATPTVCVLPLPLVHLATAVVTAAAHAEEEANYGHQDGEQQAHRRTYKEAYLVVDGLGSAGDDLKETMRWRMRDELLRNHTG